MAKILICGVHGYKQVPHQLVSWIEAYSQQGHEFLIKDGNGVEFTIERIISSCGASDRATIYSMGSTYYNKFNMPERIFKASYDENTKEATIYFDSENSTKLDESYKPDNFIIGGIDKVEDVESNRKYFEFIDRKLVDDCDVAIFVWDGSNKAISTMIQLLNIRNKQAYVLSLQ